MKEFIEKLIGRLEEELKTTREMQTIQCKGNNGYGTPLQSKLSGEICVLLKVTNIVNELAEEYSANTPQKSAGGWIPVTERLPDNKTSVLICSGEFVHEAYFEDGNFLNEYGMWYKSVTYWQPLPEPFRTEKAEWKEAVMQHFTKVD